MPQTMPKQRDKTRRSDDSLAYRELIQLLADRVGRHQLPLRDDASDIKELLCPDAVHYELSKDVLRMIYRRNGCGHLDARVQARATFAALGEIRSRLSRCRRTDIDQINLLDEIGWSLRQFFQADRRAKNAPVTATPEVLAFPQRRAV